MSSEHRPTPRDGSPDGSGASPRPEHPADRSAPFGLPVLAEVPELALVLEQLREVDHLLARIIDGLLPLEDELVAECTTGVALDQWLAAIGRRTSADRRMLITATAACRRLPSLHQAFRSHRVSWAQVRAVALKVERLPRHLDRRLDEEIGAAINGAADADPDALARVVGWTLDAIERESESPSPSSAPAHDWFAMQPRLDGSGGQVAGDFGPEGFAWLDAALNDGPPPSGEGQASREREDDTSDAGDQSDDAAVEGQPAGAGEQPPPGGGAAAAGARRRAERLVNLCRTGDPEGRGATAPPRLVGRVELSSLLQWGDAGAQLLSRLAGGVLHVDRDTAQRLTDRFGAELRVVLVDHGRIVGVGRRARQPAEWLADATLALHDTCSEPGCLTAARASDLDHARPWSRGGKTEIDNLGPLCARSNRTKERDGWRVSQSADGVRVWHHPRSGLTTRTLPATWRPPPAVPPSGAVGGSGSDPPG